MVTIKRPMLASAVEDLSSIKFPVLVSPKLDGIRCLILNGKAVTRSLKPIPNKFIQLTLEHIAVSGLDGEIIIPGKNFNEIQSAVMSEEGEPYFEYHIFDCMYGTPIKSGFDMPFVARQNILKKYELKDKRLKIVPQKTLNNLTELLNYENVCVNQGYEGVMIRDPKGPYKFGRSTLKEGYLLKLKRFKDSEAYVVGAKELMINTNKAEKNELGYTERSSKKDNLISTDMLGALFVMDKDTNKEFEIGTGFTKQQRIDIWKDLNKGNYLITSLLVKYKYQELSKDGIPRFPVFLGFRDKKDM